MFPCDIIQNICLPTSGVLCPNLESPHCKDISTLEKVQRRATKLVPSVSTLGYESRLNQFPNIADDKAIEAYRIMNNWYLTNADNIFTRVPGSTTRGHT